MRKTLIAGNWKMHGRLDQIKSLLHDIKNGVRKDKDVEVVVLPTFAHLALVRELLEHSKVEWGAQNFYIGQQGAFTGEVSAPMLAELSCTYVLVGHSERRSIFHEDLTLVAQKFKAATDAQLKPILCVGETQFQRENGETETVIREQLESVIQFAGIEAFKDAVIAYEPVWAIGTGLTATPEQAEEVHAYIRQLLMQIKVDLANTIRILYGGSMKPDNASALLAMPDIDGGLIGGASLAADSFLAICAAAEKCHTTA